jgi:hypothetical protein
MADRRPKASELGYRGRPLIVERTFEEAFPDIIEPRFEVKTVSRGSEFTDGTRIFNMSNKQVEFFDCGNPLCYGGGFSMGHVLSRMYSAQPKQTHYEGGESCRGYEGSPKGKKRYRGCTNHWKVKVDITYKAGATQSQAPT